MLKFVGIDIKGTKIDMPSSSAICRASQHVIGALCSPNQGCFVRMNAVRHSTLSKFMQKKSSDLPKMVSRAVKTVASASGSDASGPGGLKIDLRGALSNDRIYICGCGIY